MSDLRTLTLGAGCFWCLDAVYQRTAGVTEV
ncbi:MAG TPA: peptide-methionine (S)-S-oxide reductase, partial [Candidatus Brevibacterium intestinavium]|nr:peptide-methionine (S)-S-oxide reductase [Candidatus Brevibacterium intestinavium]